MDQVMQTVGLEGHNESHGALVSTSSSAGSWFATTDHKRIGIMYLLVTMLTLCAGAILGVLLRIELLDAGTLLFSREIYARLLASHGALMLLVVAPGIVGALGTFALPLLLGQRGLAFPRFSLATFYLYLFCSFFSVYHLSTLETPGIWNFFSSKTPWIDDPLTRILFAAVFLNLVPSMMAVNFIGTLHMNRSGTKAFRLPVFAWSVYISSVVQLLVTLTLIGVMPMAVVSADLGWNLLSPDVVKSFALEGSSYWFRTSPLLYLALLPACGMVTEVVATFARKQVFGYWVVVGALVLLGFSSLVAWAHQMFFGADSDYASFVYAVVLTSVVIPGCVLVFHWIATLVRGSVGIETPLLYALGTMLMITVAGLAGLVRGAPGLEMRLRESTFEVGHLHFLAAGGLLMAFLTGIHYWWPKMTGRMYSEMWGKFGWLLMMMGLSVAFFTQLMLGALGMPRRAYSFTSDVQALQAMSTVGTWILSLGGVVVVTYLIASLLIGRRAPANPWGGSTAEWRVSSPPPADNFPTAMGYVDPYLYSET